MTYKSGWRVKVIDRLGSLPDHSTHTYASPHAAERAAARLTRTYYGDSNREQFNWFYNGLEC